MLENKTSIFLYSIKMSKKTLKCKNTEVNKNQFHVCKQPIDLKLISVNQVLMPEKFEHSDKDIKKFIGYKVDDVVRPLCISYLK